MGELAGVTDAWAAQLAKKVIDELYAVLYVKDDQVIWYHASFPDFMFSRQWSKLCIFLGTDSIIDMTCNQDIQHICLTQSYFDIMESSLKFNICNLPSSYLFDSEVPDLKNQIQQNISNFLQYSCRY